MIALSVNLNKIALIRNSRPGNYPDLAKHALTCIANGADGITVHPRPDLRHVRPGDIYELHQLIGHHPGIEFNIEGNPFAAKNKDYPGLLPLVLRSPPHQCTLVPDADNQLTSDHGFDLKADARRLKPLIHELKSAGIRVSLFMDPEPDQILRAAEIGAERIELYTGPFAALYAQYGNSGAAADLFAHHSEAANHAHRAGLGINAGHDLNLLNLTLYKTLPWLQEVSIGHALTVDAIERGLANSVRAYKSALA